MVILELHVVRVAIVESERDPPSRIHRHGPLAPSRADQRVKPNRLQDAQRCKRLRSVEGIEEHQGPIIVEASEASSSAVLEQASGVAVPE